MPPNQDDPNQQLTEPTDPQEYWDPDYEYNPRSINPSVLIAVIAVVFMTAIASGAIGYILGSNNAFHTPPPQPYVAQATSQTSSEPTNTPNPPSQANQSRPVDPTTPPQDSRPQAPEFFATTMTGNEFRLSQTIGNPTLLVFWSHW